MILLHLIIGALVMQSFWYLSGLAKKRHLQHRWYHRTFTFAIVIYEAFVLEMILGFWEEGEPQAALVMGAIMGIIGVALAILLIRLVYNESKITKVISE